jgi:hypothetical protein
VTPVEPKKRASAATPKASAATHKRATKKTVETALASAKPTLEISHTEIARVAYSFWEARGYQPGNPEEDWLCAERQLLELSQNR